MKIHVSKDQNAWEHHPLASPTINLEEKPVRNKIIQVSIQLTGARDHSLNTNFGENPRQQRPKSFGGLFTTQHIKKWWELAKKRRS